MSRIKQLQDAIVSSNVRVSQALRMSLIVAGRYGHQRYVEWATLELENYANDKDLPEYRIFRLLPLKAVTKRTNWELGTVAITNLASFPKEHLEVFTTVYLPNKMGFLEDMLEKPDREHAVQYLPELGCIALSVAFHSHEIDGGILSLYHELPIIRLQSVLDTVRSKMLKFIMDIEAQQRDFEDDTQEVAATESKPTGDTYNTQIYGGAVNLAQGGHDFQQTSNVTNIDKQLIQQIDWEALRNDLPLFYARLKAAAADANDYMALASVTEAQKAIEVGDENKTLEALKRVGGFIGDKLTDLGVSIVGEVIKRLMIGG